jgi:hypothetical protein
MMTMKLTLFVKVIAAVGACALLVSCGTNTPPQVNVNSTYETPKGNLEGLETASQTTQNISERPENFKEGLWIKKYQGNFTCFKFETPSGIKIIVDPYGMDKEIIPDIVTESHRDDDHSDTFRLRGDYALVNTAGEFTIKGIKITGISGYHNKGDTTETNRIYVFDIDGIRIAQFASQGAVPAEETLNKIKSVDILIIQFMKGADKLTPEESRDIAKKLNAKIIIPAHGDQHCNSYFSQLMEGTSKDIHTGELVITRSELDAIKSPQVMVLDH